MTETRTLHERADAWVVWASRTAFGDKHLRLQIEEAAYLLDALLAQPPAQGDISEEDRRDAISLAIFVGRNNVPLDNASLASCREYVEACELLRLALPTQDKET